MEANSQGSLFIKTLGNILDKLQDRLYAEGKVWGEVDDVKFMEQFPKSKGVSVTRDPMFASRAHGHVGNDIRFVIDKDDLIKKGLRIQPFAEGGYQKTWRRRLFGPSDKEFSMQLNPNFEFEERIRGNIPTSLIKLIDLQRLPRNEPNISENMLKLLRQLSKTDIPIIKSSSVRDRLGKIPVQFPGLRYRQEDILEDVYRLMDTPTYKFKSL